jgi:hypothetical protein
MNRISTEIIEKKSEIAIGWAFAFVYPKLAILGKNVLFCSKPAII